MQENNLTLAFKLISLKGDGMFPFSRAWNIPVGRCSLASDESMSLLPAACHIFLISSFYISESC